MNANRLNEKHAKTRRDAVIAQPTLKQHVQGEITASLAAAKANREGIWYE